MFNQNWLLGMWVEKEERKKCHIMITKFTMSLDVHGILKVFCPSKHSCEAPPLIDLGLIIFIENRWTM